MCNYDFSPRGRIWLGWLTDELIVDVKFDSEHVIIAEDRSDLDSHKFHFVVVYGIHSIADRRPLWLELQNFNSYQSSALCYDGKL